MDLIPIQLLKRKYPGFNEVDDQSFGYIMYNLMADPERSKTLLLQKKFSDMPENCQTALDAFRLPEGWGFCLQDMANRVINGISGGESLTVIADLVGDPSLILLLQIVRTYAIFSNGKEGENLHLGALMSNAQELLDLFKLVLKLRNGGTRLHQRIIECLDRLLNVDW